MDRWNLKIILFVWFNIEYKKYVFYDMCKNDYFFELIWF